MYDMATIFQEEDGTTTYEDVGTFPTREAAILEASRRGPAEFAISEADAGHYEEFIHVTHDGKVSVSDDGQSGTWHPYEAR